MLSLVARYRRTPETSQSLAPTNGQNATNSQLSMMLRSVVVLVVLALRELIVLLVKLVAFGRREALMTMVPNWNRASAEPDAPNPRDS